MDTRACYRTVAIHVYTSMCTLSKATELTYTFSIKCTCQSIIRLNLMFHRNFLAVFSISRHTSFYKREELHNYWETKLAPSDNPQLLFPTFLQFGTIEMLNVYTYVLECKMIKNALKYSSFRKCICIDNISIVIYKHLISIETVLV